MKELTFENGEVRDADQEDADGEETEN